MPTDYDPIAGQYQRAKRQPWRGHVELTCVVAQAAPTQHDLAVPLEPLQRGKDLRPGEQLLLQRRASRDVR